MARIIIENLRHISKLTFEIPKPGVWLLTGPNGTGKSSVLGCLRRIGYKNAFPVHFPASRKSDQLDSNEGASISYETADGTVSYKYKTERWVPTPKSHGHLLETLKYPEVLFIAADADRIEPRKEDVVPRKVKPASAQIIQAANVIFGTRKFDNLKVINVSQGVTPAFLLELPVQPKAAKKYYSEKNLSLGELCILKLLRKLAACKKGAMILIDEIELALHPTAQSELLKYLVGISKEKSLTVVVSTHSATLIKQSSRHNILYLQVAGSGEISCSVGCYPTYVLGAMASQEEFAADVIVYVEDEAAKIVVNQFARRYLADAFNGHDLMPGVQAIAVGGFTNVLRFYVQQKPLLPAVTRAYVMLDADAEESLDGAQKDDIVRIYKSESASISFLPFTPEVGLAHFIHDQREKVIGALKDNYMSRGLLLKAKDVPTPPLPDEPKARDTCKAIVDSVCDSLVQQLPSSSVADVKKVLLQIFAEDYFDENKAAVMALFGPIVKGRQKQLK
ncbi:ATP-dependent endonuclease [Pseudomonas sp. NBRC 111119]|uniref:ATP-dependent nuclease n=1 Tax=Pseudomonas sp. NBRC 111119 TaxID=1661034 RepID=UPI001C47608B|nr:AAA family ATPase [Pseudomonas sp. NBRC 111119]